MFTNFGREIVFSADLSYNYEDEIRLEHESSLLELCLKQITKGHKIYFGLVKVYFELFEEIKDKEHLFTPNDMLVYKYLTKLISLLERDNQNLF